MSGASSPFIGGARNKNGVTWGSIRSDPQVTAFCSYRVIGYAFWDRVVTVLFVTRNAFKKNKYHFDPRPTSGGVARVIYMFL